MKRIGLFFAVAVIGTLLAASASAQEGQAPDWANKNGAVGVGGSTTLGGVNGVHIRTYVSPQFGLHLTLGFGSTSVTLATDAGDTTTTTTQIVAGLYGEFKLAYWQRGSLSAVFGIDINNVSTATETPAGDTDLSGTDILIGVGLQGEYFPTQYLSLFAETGIVLDFIGENEVTGTSVAPDDPTGVETSGLNVALGSDLWGAAGFTVWFK
jgi:hypothetical protein